MRKTCSPGFTSKARPNPPPPPPPPPPTGRPRPPPRPLHAVDHNACIALVDVVLDHRDDDNRGNLALDLRGPRLAVPPRHRPARRPPARERRLPALRHLPA